MKSNETEIKEVGEVIVEKSSLSKIKLKNIWEHPEIQRIVKQFIDFPQIVYVREVNKRSEKYNTQKVEAYGGTGFADMIRVNFTISGENASFLDPVQSINKWYRIIDYTLGLVANTSGGGFSGYSATGLKLVVSRLEEVKK